MISNGDAEVIITGGADATITPTSIAGFSNMKALTKNNDYNTANKPFDLNRDGNPVGNNFKNKSNDMPDGMIEHIFERIYINVLDELNLKYLNY